MWRQVRSDSLNRNFRNGTEGVQNGKLGETVRSCVVGHTLVPVETYPRLSTWIYQSFRYPQNRLKIRTPFWRFIKIWVDEVQGLVYWGRRFGKEDFVKRDFGESYVFETFESIIISNGPFKCKPETLYFRKFRPPLSSKSMEEPYSLNHYPFNMSRFSSFV